MTLSSALSITQVTLIFGPLAGAISVQVFRRRSALCIKWLTALCLTYLSLLTFASIGRVKTISTDVNFALCIASYFAYCFLASATWTFKPTRPFRVVGIAMYVSLLPGYLLATVGILGLGFVLGDQFSSQLQVKLIAPEISCMVKGWGGAWGPSGYDVILYKTPAWLPVIEYQFAGAHVVQTEPHSPDVTCFSLYATIK